ncbi:DUF6182 family protein [Streptomyces sp. CBMA152]|uniref:DUF6182 family protein n=1 Tax=Streptomyces sp. CBMA152 TaxID=1896312 RepID=UPI00166095B0|nr:DUF6182 family protein [Streptomyces sp. CBMA152]MBD0742450.1 hypothetical protein [Streptomyces sp. CBMA152]
MPLTQRRLHDEAYRRLRDVRPELATPAGESDLAALLRARAEAVERPGTDAVLAVAVLRGFDPAAWVRDAAAFALGLAPDTAAAWRRSFTRTVYLAGNPENLLGRYSFDHLAEDGSVGWCGPAPAGNSAGLRRLLKLFLSTAPFPVGPPTTITVPTPAANGGDTTSGPLGRALGRPTVPLPHGPASHRPAPRAAVHRDLYVAASGVPVPEALVHLNHLVVEAALDGLIGPGDRLTLRSVPSLTGAVTPFAALRVDVDRTHPHQLRAFAALTEETPDV